MSKFVTINHPDVEGEATVVATSLPVWEAKGWEVVPGGDSEQLPEDSQPALDFDAVDDTVDEDDVADD